jgi:hypothetical protein
MRKTLLLMLSAGLIATSFAGDAFALNTTAHGGGHAAGHVAVGHGGGGHFGNGHGMRGGGGNRPVHIGRGRIGAGAAIGFGVPFYAGGLDDYDAYDSDQVPDYGDSSVTPVLYYCDNPQGYYPDVMICNDDWQPVQGGQ